MQLLSGAAPPCGACPESARKGATSPAPVKLPRNLQADSCSNVRHLRLDKSQTRPAHKGGNANGRCCTKRRSHFRACANQVTLRGALRTGSRPKARFLLPTRLAFAHFCEPTIRSTSKGGQLATAAADRALMLQADRHAHPRLLGHLHLFGAAGVLPAHLAVAICAKYPQFSPIATNCNCTPPALPAWLLRPPLANASNRAPPPVHVELEA